MILYTHVYDFLAKVISLGAAVAVSIYCLGFGAQQYLAVGLVMFIGVPAWWFLLRPASSWVYARRRLGVSLSWQQAKLASTLFSPPNVAHWYPMREICVLPATDRINAIEDAVQTVLRRQQAEKAKWQTQAAWFRIVEWILGVTFLVVFFAALFGSLEFEALTNLMQTLGTSSQVLNAIVIAGPIMCVLLMFDRWFKK